MNSSLSRTLCACLFLFLLKSLQAATPLEEIRSLSGQPTLDLTKLRRGEIVVQRGALGDFSRGVHLQSSYLVHRPMATVGNALLHWNPIEHHDAEVRMYHEYALPGSAADFQTLHLQPRSADDKWLLERTAEVSRGTLVHDLHLTGEEFSLAKGKDADTIWRQVLSSRAAALARGGLAAVPAYGSDRKISPLSELRGLLGLAPKALHHFESIINSRPFKLDGKLPSETVPYWEGYVAHQHTTLQLGLFAAQKSENSWQLINCVYYPSDTYFMSIDLYQLWPVEDGTLVWQVSFVSALFRSYLGGFDRFVAGKLQAEETTRTIREFRSELEKDR